jgi:chemotaxis protein methyltransferase CheR
MARADGGGSLVNASLDRAHVERFRGYVRERLGFEVEDSDSLEETLRDRILESRSGGVDDYFRLLLAPGRGREELRAIAKRVTVGETYFFRNPDQLAVFEDVCVPARAASSVLRVLSAGCASGEEAYTVAIRLVDRIPDLARWTIAITGIDVNASLVEKARRARYSTWALRQTSADIRSRHFRPEGRDYVLEDRIRHMVSFEERNLLDDDPSFWRPAAFDVVFFRNVQIYFSPEATRAVVSRIARSLAPGGHLFLGEAETLRNVSTDFHLRHTHGAFYYELESGTERRAMEPTRPPATGEALVAADAFWVDAIRQASERIARLGASSAEPPPSEPRRAAWDLSLATALIREERFADALELLRRLPAESARDPDAQLLRAALLTNKGSIAEAEALCEVVLELDELNAGAHYLKALCREHAGDAAAAAEEDRTAIHLDPSFAMPHLHLGLLARRSGDANAARTSLARAIDLLGREDPSRVLIFGGGFNREALVLLCRAELRACGGGR